MKRFYYFLFASLLSFFATACSSDGESIEELTVSIQNNGTEIGDNEVVQYSAEKDIFGDYVAGNDVEPVIKTSQPCKLEVSVTIPKSDLLYLQWCGVTHECEQYAEAGTYTRTRENMEGSESMDLHAYFKKGVSAKCNVKVAVKVNGKLERTFYLSYSYVASEEDKEDDKEDGNQPEEIQLSIQNDGKEIKENEVIRYEAKEDLFGYLVAGHATDPSFSASAPCKFEVELTIPEHTADYFQWCGITEECLDYKEKGTYTRVVDNLNQKVFMQLHAYFKKGTAATCRVKVVAKANTEIKRTFYLEYVYQPEVTDPDVEDENYAKPAFRSPVVAVEFTGQRCRYCPNLSRALKGSEEKFGRENYIITALHSLERFSLLPEGHVSLYNAEAKEYAASIDVHDGLPQLAYNTLGPKVPDEYLDDMFKEADLLECTGTVRFNQDREFLIDIQTRLRSDRKEFIRGKKIDILFWAMENDIVALQDDNGAWTYPSHQHIFRGSINSTWGESYQIGSSYRKTWAVPSSVSVLANSEVVVFFLDHETRTILDAARFSVSA